MLRNFNVTGSEKSNSKLNFFIYLDWKIYLILIYQQIIGK